MHRNCHKQPSFVYIMHCDICPHTTHSTVLKWNPHGRLEISSKAKDVAVWFGNHWDGLSELASDYFGQWLSHGCLQRLSLLNTSSVLNFRESCLDLLSPPPQITVIPALHPHRTVSHRIRGHLHSTIMDLIKNGCCVIQVKILSLSLTVYLLCTPPF